MTYDFGNTGVGFRRGWVGGCVRAEPEAASIYCQHLPIQKLHGSSPGFVMTEVGTKYMVVDLGGILIN
jgi:hypothetical protein